MQERLRLEQLETRYLLSGTWTGLTNQAYDPLGIGTMMLLSDGTVMAQGGDGDNASKDWYRLTPDSTGSYANGTWSTRGSMRLERLYYGSNVLPDGRVFLVGGEYTGPSSLGTFTNTGEMYDPVTDTWSNIANFPQSQFGDDPTMVLPDGRVLGGYLQGPQTYIYNPATNAWTATGTKLRGDRSDEETWVKLTDDSILDYECFTESGGIGHAQRYLPASGTWVDAGTVPTALSGGGQFGFEMGPATVLPDGRVFHIGANSHTAFYNPGSNTWTAGTSVPNSSTGRLQGADDAPGVLMPNGHVLLSVDNVSPQLFQPPTTVYEFDPTANGGLGSYTDVTPSIPGMSTNVPAYTTHMLMLPSGQVLFTAGTNQLAVYTPNEAPSDSWRSTVSTISNSGNTFTLTGTLLNGISGGASYGDDAEMDSNFPLVQLTDASGTVAYARTANWSSTSVFAPGSTTPETVQFTLPSGTNPGAYLLNTVANGISSPTVLSILMSPTANNITIDLNSSGQLEVLQGGAPLAAFTLGGSNPITSIIVVGDASTDTLTVDYSNGDPLPAGGLQFQAGTGTATLNVNDMANPSDQTYILGTASVLRSGSSTITYAGINSLTILGGSGNNTLIGANTANAWEVSAANQGTVTGAASGGSLVSFANMQNLTAGLAGDYFLFDDGTSIAGNLTGGGFDTVDYTAWTTSVIVDLQTGVATGVGGSISGIGVLYGGSGVPAGSGVYNLLIGAGGEYLQGGTGRRNILVGGGGYLVGGDGEDLIIAGITSYDTEPGLASWQAIAAYWASSVPFATRAANLTTGSGVPLLDPSTVTGDGGGATLVGNGGVALIYTDGLNAIGGFDPNSQFVTISP